ERWREKDEERERRRESDGERKKEEGKRPPGQVSGDTRAPLIWCKGITDIAGFLSEKLVSVLTASKVPPLVHGEKDKRIKREDFVLSELLQSRHGVCLPRAASVREALIGFDTSQALGCKGRCTRENCKYLHPPAHLKTQLEINGRNNLIQQKTAAAMLAQQMPFMFPGTTMQPTMSFPISQGLGSNPGLSYAPYLTHMTHSMGMMPTEMLQPSTQSIIVPGSPPCSMQSSSSNQKLLRTDKLETDCRFAHPSDSPMIDTSDNTVTVCMDYIKSRCSREKCKYFHPPAHLQAKIKAAQHQANQTAVAVQAAAMAFPHGCLQPLPKRPALEKSNGASSLFHPIPMMYSATPATISAATTPATSVPYAAAAPANQVCSF
ncbi:unnamed protein product, partial [Coregonus sp. 'balchen']